MTSINQPPRALPWVFVVTAIALAVAVVSPFTEGILWGVVLAGVTYPVYKRLSSKMEGKSKAKEIAAILCVLLVLVTLAIPILTLIFVAYGQYVAYGQNGAPQGINSIVQQIANAVNPMLAQAGSKIDIYQEWIQRKTEITQAAGRTGLRFASRTGQNLWSLIIGFITQYFVLKDTENWRKFGRNKLGVQAADFDRVATAAFKMAQAVFKGVVLVAIVQGVSIGIAFLAVGVKQWIIFTLLSCMLAMIPMLGTPLVYFPVAISLLAEGKTWQGVVILVVGFGLVSQIDNILRPFFIGGDTGMHPLVVFFALLGGVLLLGPVGIMVGPIIVAVAAEIWEIYRPKSAADEIVSAGAD